MNDGVDIVVLDDPTIELEELSVTDYESNSDNQEEAITHNSMRTNAASLSPIVKINEFILNATYIEEFEIDCTGFVPECTVVFHDVSEQFSEINYPKDGDLMKVYIGTGGMENTWKPIRIDFNIMNIDNWYDNGVQVFEISGEMEIPNFELDRCEVFKDKSSFDTCREIAQNLKLGYSSNITSTDDAQVWLNSYGNDHAFLQKIVKHAYMNENSFFTAFIDPYYYLNFVECNAIINDADNDETTVEQLPEVKYLADCINVDPDFKDVEENTAPDFITNSNQYANSTIGISYYGPINNCGSITHRLGKKVYTRYWDDNEEEYRVEFITPFISEGNNLKQMTQHDENNEDSVKENTKKIIMRAQTENMHKNYNYAEVCNKLNLGEIDKYGLSVNLSGFNPQITRFSKKYVAIYSLSPMVQTNMLEKEEETGNKNEYGEGGAILNKELSGFYTVTGISYILQDGYLTTQLDLRKRAIKSK